MDPNEALIDIVLGMLSADKRQTNIAAEALRGWLINGGFMPRISDSQLVTILEFIEENTKC